MAVRNGTESSDTLFGSEGNDTLLGGGGNDRLVTLDGTDSVEGGDGNDEINGFRDATGTLMVWTHAGSKTLDGGAGNDYVFGGTSDDTLTGGAGADYLDGRSGNDSLSGGADADFLMGSAGNDTLSGGGGFDTLYGGTGNDTYLLDSRTIGLYDEGGNDSARVTADFVKVPVEIEAVTYAAGVQRLPYWLDGMLESAAGGFLGLLGQARTYHYAFPATLPSYADAEDASGWLPFTPVQSQRAIAAFDYVETLVDVQFTASSNVNAERTFVFANNLQASSAGYASPPSEHLSGHDVYLNIDPSNTTLADGTYGVLVLMHEIGHALGLKHPGQTEQDPPYLPASDNRMQWTVMTYENDDWEAYGTLQYRPLDIAALQYIYGPSLAVRTGNDTYTVSGSTSNFIWDGVGNDTLDASAASAGATLYLTPGYWGYIGSAPAASITAAGQVTVNFGSTIEGLKGSTFSDRLYGNDAANTIDGGAGNDVLEGGAGNDTLTGGSGVDTARYATTHGAATASAAGGTVTVNAGALGTDRLSGVERVAFSDVNVAFDLDGNAGKAARIIGATLGPEALANEFYVGIGIGLLDAGRSYADVALTAASAALSGSVTNARLVDLLFTNVIGRAPTAAEAAPFLQMLGAGTSQAALVTLAADTPYNLDRIGFTGLAQTGIEYV